MGNLLTHLRVKNFRCWAAVSIDMRPINVLLVPMGRENRRYWKQFV